MLVALFAFPAIACAQERNFAFAGSGFGLSLPAGLTATRQSGDDYDLYSFARSGRVVLQAYVGNEPIDKVFVEHRQYTTSGWFGDLPEESIVYAYPNDVQSRETIVSLNNATPWPKFVHLWYLDLTPDDALAADRIIESVGASSAVWTAPAIAPGSWTAQAEKLLQHQKIR